MALLALPMVAASCIFPPPIDTSGNGTYAPPAVQSETPLLSDDIVMVADTPPPSVTLDVEEQDPSATLYARVFVDYSSLNQVPAVQEDELPPPSGTTGSSSAVRTLSIPPGPVPICSSHPNSAQQQVGPGSTPHHLTVVVADRPFDDFSCNTHYQCVQQGRMSTQVSWTFYCTPAGGDI